MSFALFKLPFVALKEVFKSMDPHEILLISMTSRRVKQWIPKFIPKNRFHIHLSFYDGLRIIINDQEFRLVQTPEYTRMWISSSKRYMQINHGSCDQEFIRDLIEQVLDVFNRPRVSLRFDNGIQDSFAVQIIELVKNRGLQVPRLVYELTYSSVEAYQKVLEINPATEVLRIGSRLPSTFQFNPPPFTLDHLSISGASHWVHLEDFINCKYIHISQFSNSNSLPQMTPRYFNSVFKLFMIKDCRIEQINIGHRFFYSDEQWEEMIDGLDGVEGNGDEKELEFRRKNGKMAKITLTWMNLMMMPC